MVRRCPTARTPRARPEAQKPTDAQPRMPPRRRSIPWCGSPLVQFPDHIVDPVTGLDRNQRPAPSDKGVESPHNQRRPRRPAGLGRRPFKPETRVRIPSGPRGEPRRLAGSMFAGQVVGGGFGVTVGVFCRVGACSGFVSGVVGGPAEAIAAAALDNAGPCYRGPPSVVIPGVAQLWDSAHRYGSPGRGHSLISA